MWLLNTHDAKLHDVADTRSLPGGYAILSHTWSGAEQSFREVRDICARSEGLGQNPRYFVSDKIRNCCIIAERDGYDWVWIDSCCIDKSSSAELSEAINSMFDWYVLAEVCYVYLEDVRSDPNANPAEFIAARWHTRGWALQELLAPDVLVFLSSDWKPVGTKQSLCSLVSQATRIPEAFITRQLDMFQAPVGQRMSWASGRKTTRVEDEAYCLLGIFSINMPTLYGEGRRAFQRLQLEIVKQSQDTTLLAWGGWPEETLNPMDPSAMLSGSPSLVGPARFLLTLSPSNYMGAYDTSYTPRVSQNVVLQPYLPSQWSEKVRDLPSSLLPDADKFISTNWT